MRRLQALFLGLLATNRKYYFAPIVVAAIMSYVSSRYLFVGSGLSLLPWGIIAVLWGIVSRTKRDAGYNGATYGFSQAFIFLWIDKKGGLSLAQFLALVVIITFLGIMAGLCAMLVSKVSFKLKSSR